MKTLKILLVAVMACCVAFALCACGQDTPSDDDTTPDGTTTTPSSSVSKPVDDGKVTYIVVVEDDAGAPIPNVMVQLCKDACVPGITDESGEAAFTLPEDDYKVSLMTMPVGYDYATEEKEFYFADGQYALTIILKAAG